MGTLLVVDDSRTIRQAVQMTFQNTGIQVLEAESVPQGLEILRQHKPDMVLTDLVLQGDVEAGFSFAEQALSDGRTSRIPIFILAGKNRNVDKKRAKLIGAKVFIKPFDTQDLIDLVELTIAENGARQDAAPAPTAPTQSAMPAAAAPRMTMQMGAFNPDAFAAPATPFGVPAQPKPTGEHLSAAPMADPFAAPAADPFAAPPKPMTPARPAVPSRDPFAAAPQNDPFAAPAADPFAAPPKPMTPARPATPSRDPFAAAPQNDPFAAPAADPFAAPPKPMTPARPAAPSRDPFAAPAADPFAASPKADPFALAVEEEEEPVEMSADDLEMMDEIDDVEEIEPGLEQTSTPVEFDEGDLDLIADDEGDEELEEPSYDGMVTTDDVVADAGDDMMTFPEDDPFGPLPEPPSAVAASANDPFAGLDEVPLEEEPLDVAPMDSPKDPFAGLADPGYEDEPFRSDTKAPRDPFAGLNEPEPELEPELDIEPVEMEAEAAASPEPELDIEPVEMEAEPEEAMEVERVEAEPFEDEDFAPVEAEPAPAETEDFPELDSVELDEDAAEPVPTAQEMPIPAPTPTPEPVELGGHATPTEIEVQTMAEAQFFATQTQTVKAPDLGSITPAPKAVEPMSVVSPEPVHQEPIRITDPSLEAHGDIDSADLLDGTQLAALLRQILREERIHASAATQAVAPSASPLDMNRLRDMVRDVVREELRSQKPAPAPAPQAVDTAALTAAVSKVVKAELAALPAPKAAPAPQAVDTAALTAAVSKVVKAELANLPAPQAAQASDKLADGHVRTIVKVVAETVHSVIHGEMANVLAKMPAPQAAQASGGGADLAVIRQAIHEEIAKLMSQKIEAIAWEVVPPMAETILKRVIAQRQS